MGSYYKKFLNDWKATLDVKADVVFDIGGAQDPIKGMTKSWDVGEYFICDLSMPHVVKQPPDFIQDMNLPWNPMRRTDLDGKIEYNFQPIQADLIFMLGVMDYVINPNVALNNLYHFLKDDGTAWVEFPFVYPIHNPKDDEGCRYSEGCIRRLAKQAGLEIEEIIYKTPNPNNPYLIMFYKADGMRMADGVDHNVIGYIVRLRK